MPKRKTSKSFLIVMGALCPVTIALYFGLVPELEAMRRPKVPGDLSFPPERPCDLPKRSDKKSSENGNSGFSIDWFTENYENLMTWDQNPWKIPKTGFSDHYFKLLGSKDPMDQARAKVLRRLADALHQRLLERYPELAVAAKQVPPERNGFLKWLEFSERFSSVSQPKGIDFPDDLTQHLNGKGPWNAEAVKAWLAGHKPLLNEIRAIGLMPEQSIEGIDIHRYAFTGARLAKECSEALLMEARLAAENGDVSAALKSVQASNGLATHFANVETPSLLAAGVQLLIQLQTQKYAFSEIMPALPTGQLDPAAWESVLNPTVSPPGEFARIMKGHWSVIFREYILPPLVDAEDPKCPPDSEALLDAISGYFVDVVHNHEGRAMSDWPAIPGTDIADSSHLSRRSRELFSIFITGDDGWKNGMNQSLCIMAMNQAAFAVMKGENPPNDPIYGLPYRWDPSTRTLSAPDSPAFANMKLEPIKVPKK